VLQNVDFQFGECIFILIAMVWSYYNGILMYKHRVPQVSPNEHYVFQLPPLEEEVLVAAGHLHLLVNYAVLAREDDVEEFLSNGLLPFDLHFI
jgi:hypothetical protein